MSWFPAFSLGLRRRISHFSNFVSGKPIRKFYIFWVGVQVFDLLVIRRPSICWFSQFSIGDTWRNGAISMFFDTLKHVVKLRTPQDRPPSFCPRVHSTPPPREGSTAAGPNLASGNPRSREGPPTGAASGFFFGDWREAVGKKNWTPKICQECPFCHWQNLVFFFWEQNQPKNILKASFQLSAHLWRTELFSSNWGFPFPRGGGSSVSPEHQVF